MARDIAGSGRAERARPVARSSRAAKLGSGRDTGQRAPADALGERWKQRPRIDTRFADAKSASLLVGPEGGISDEEAGTAIEAGWQPVSMGPRLLRAETAAIAAVTIIMHLSGDLG